MSLYQRNDQRQARHPVLRIGWPRRSRFGALLIVAASIVTFLLALVMPFWLPRTIRDFIPDRYFVAYAPKPIQDIIFTRVGEMLVPTFAPPPATNDAALLNSLLATSTTRPIPNGIDATPTAPRSVNPTQVIAQLPPTPTATALPPLPVSFSLGESNFRDTPQHFNNCGPATLTMLLSYWGVNTTQEDVAAYVKPNLDGDSNVRPDELAAYVQSRGYQAIVRVNGTLDLLKRFIANGFPVMVEKGFDVEGHGWMGHYVLLFAYSDADQKFISMDSYLGAGHVYTYDAVGKYWPQFNRTYLVVYRPDQAAQVAEIIGPEIDDTVMYNNALNVARDELNQTPDDVFGWFDVGSDLVGLRDYSGAAAAFDESYRTGRVPSRMLWYQFGPYEAYLHAGRYDDVRKLADQTLVTYFRSEEAYYYKALTYMADGNVAEARQQLELALLYNKNYQAAQAALNNLGSQP